MAISELGRIAEIDRSEHIAAQYRSRGGVLELIDVDLHASRWSERAVQEHVDAWRTVLERGGVLFGAFDGDRLVGVAVYDRAFPEEPARLAFLHVTQSHRRSGIGRALTAAVVRSARAEGASRLYVSATPTRATVDFYLREGFTPLATPNEALLALEPEDIHLALLL
jgi:predicted N-acetyltransferase YhbS